MKSVLDVLHHSVPEEFQAIAEDVIREWEVFSRNSGTFLLEKAYGERYKLSPEGREYAPLLVMGESVTFFMKCGYANDAGIYKESDGSWNIDPTKGVYKPLQVCKGRLSTECGSVQDIFDIQPHEYGILKLKYGLTKDMMFVPSYLKKFTPEGCSYD